MTIPGIDNPAIPLGSSVVVTGVTGFIGSHVAEQILAAGYKVRGTTRNVQKGAWAEQYYKNKYGSDNFELWEVQDMAAEGAFDEVVKGATGFVHVANDMTHSTDPNVAIPRAVKGALNALKASAKAQTLRRFVFTSSSFAATQPKPGRKFTITTQSYNDEAVERAWKPDADGETVYSASKVEAERAIFRWLKENKHSLIVNTVLPNANIGPIISSKNQGYPTSARWVKALWDGDYDSLRGTPPQHFVNVEDDARLHVIGLVNLAVQGERIFAITGPVNLNDIIRILRKIQPQKDWADFPDDTKDLSTFEPKFRAEQLHREAYGTGFIDLETSVRGNAADLIARDQSSTVASKD